MGYFMTEDIILDDNAFQVAAQDLANLKTRTESLKEKLEQMYKDITTAMQTPAGSELEFTSKNVLIKPISDMLLIIGHVSDTLDDIRGKGYYNDVFVKYETLNQNINFN